MKVGQAKNKVLARKGTKGPMYKASGSTHETITCSVIISAAGECAAVRLVYKGERDVHRGKLDQLGIPKDGITGEWLTSVSEKGWVNRSNFKEILSDLDRHCTKNDVARPIVCFIDGYAGHKARILLH